MKSFRKIALQLLGFDRRERRGTCILALLLLILIMVRLFAYRPGSYELTDPDTASVAQPGNTDEMLPAEASSLFTFDPNTASHDELIRLGLTDRQVSTLINYRNAGAHFRGAQDLSKVYGIDSETVTRLISWVRIEGSKQTKDNSRNILPHEKRTVPPVVSGGLTSIDLNRCSAEDLMELKGIGPVLSARIIKYRRLLGGFVDAHQLTEVYGLDSSVVMHICHMLTVTYDSLTPIVLDSSSYRDLARHPYIGPETAGLIIRYRELTDVPVTLAGLVHERVMSRDQASRLAPYVKPSHGVSGDEYEFILSKVLK
jgi:competence protein ComEA